jgi:hypothetical protein
VIENEWLLGLSGLASVILGPILRPPSSLDRTAVRAVIGEPVLGLQDLGCACGAGGDERGLRRAQAFAADRLDVGYPQWREAITLSVCRSNSTSRIWRGARRAGRVVAGEPNCARR